MSRDIVLITVESLRYDYRHRLPVLNDFEMVKGITPGNYTRPSLAGLLSGRYECALQAGVDGRTLATALSSAGYSTAAVSYSPQTVPDFGFDTGFEKYHSLEGDDGPLARGSVWRETLSRIGPLRRLHRRLVPKSATLANLPPDGTAVSEAISAYESMHRPRFLWVHLMDSHRPYGRGDEALPDDVGRAAAAATPDSRVRTLSDAQHRMVTERYRAGLRRASGHVRRLTTAVDDDAAVIVAGDHGEELGEDGYYFHGGYRQRVVNTLTRVPVAVRNLDLCRDRLGLIDLPPLVASVAGADIPGEWDGGRDSWLTVAPWAESVTVAYTAGPKTLVFRGAAPRTLEQPVASRDVREKLAALGYQ